MSNWLQYNQDGNTENRNDRTRKKEKAAEEVVELIVKGNAKTTRLAAERLVCYVDEIGAGPNRVEQTFGYFWRPKKSLFIVNLNHPEDNELRKMVSMIKRKFVER